MNELCGGCGEILQVDKPVHPHERYGLLCRRCHLFAQDCEAEVRSLRLFAEALSVIEVEFMFPPALGRQWRQ